MTQENKWLTPLIIIIGFVTTNFVLFQKIQHSKTELNESIQKTDASIQKIRKPFGPVFVPVTRITPPAGTQIILDPESPTIPLVKDKDYTIGFYSKDSMGIENPITASNIEIKAISEPSTTAAQQGSYTKSTTTDASSYFVLTNDKLKPSNSTPAGTYYVSISFTDGSTNYYTILNIRTN